MIRRDVWEKIGGFDERFYPLWFEDVDFRAARGSAGLPHVLYTSGCGQTHRRALHPEDATGDPRTFIGMVVY